MLCFVALYCFLNGPLLSLLAHHIGIVGQALAFEFFGDGLEKRGVRFSSLVLLLVISYIRVSWSTTLSVNFVDILSRVCCLFLEAPTDLQACW